MTQKMLPDEVDYVIYHSPCSDGTGSGLVAWKYLSTKFPERPVIYKPMPIGALPPDDVIGRNVLICDYSYRKDILLDLIPKVNKLLIIDHHKSAEKDLADIDDQYKIFDMSHSGAVLTWNYFYCNQKMPLLIAYIEDRDIWKKALPGSDDFFAVISILPHEFEVYNKYLEDDNLVLDMINNTGKKYGELNTYYADHSAGYAVPKFSRIKNKYYIVGYVNSTVLKSDVGNVIFSKLPLIDFSVAYSVNDKADSTSFSLRSTNKHVDVSKIAFKFSGGGHACASGLKVDYLVNTLPGKVYDHGEVYKQLEKVYYGTVTFEDIIKPTEDYMIVQNITLNVIYLHSTFYQHQIGSYFLQTKYKTQNKDKEKVQDKSQKVDPVKVQVGSCLKEGMNQHLDLSAIWSYNVETDMTEYVVTFDKHLDSDVKNKFIKCLTDNKVGTIEYIEDRTVKISYNGLVKQLLITKDIKDQKN